MSMSEKCNTLHRLLHFNFYGICDQSVMSLTPSGDPQPICSRPQNPGGEVGGGGRDTFDWWWCELNRKRWRESFYQARNTSGLKCSCTTPLYNAAAWTHITKRQEPRWEPLVIVAPLPHHPKLCCGRGTGMGHVKQQIQIIITLFSHEKAVSFAVLSVTFVYRFWQQA